MEKIYISGLLFGVFILYIFFGTEIKCGSDPKILINIPPLIINSKIYIGDVHLHHWALGLIIILFCFLLKSLFFNHYLFYFFYGFSIILIIHGLFYQDCFDFR